MAQYTFKDYPYMVFAATFAENHVTLSYFFLSIRLTNQEFNGLLWIGKLDRFF